MHRNWPEYTETLNPPLAALRAGAPDVMKGFSSMARAALENRALDSKTKELIALGISVAIRCDDCIGFHSEAAAKRGATREEVMEALGMAVYLGGGPSVMYAGHAVEAFDQFSARLTAGRERVVPA